jgi:hypothetical protein
MTDSPYLFHAGDMPHIPAGPEHRHKPSVIGSEIVRYVLTEFDL